MKKDYWARICKLQKKQEAKGLKKYGQVLEANELLTFQERILHIQEELIDGLMYLEHLKEKVFGDFTRENEK